MGSQGGVTAPVRGGKIRGGGEKKRAGRMASEPSNNLYFAVKTMI